MDKEKINAIAKEIFRDKGFQCNCGAVHDDEHSVNCEFVIGWDIAYEMAVERLEVFVQEGTMPNFLIFDTEKQKIVDCWTENDKGERLPDPMPKYPPEGLDRLSVDVLKEI